jgi:hypothetical protein
MLFSQRRGLRSASKIMQLSGMDDPLRNGLWSVLYDVYFQRFDNPSAIRDANFAELCHSYWLSLFKKPTDTIPRFGNLLVKALRQFWFGCEWYDAYDFLEFSVQHGPSHLATQLHKYSNVILQRETSGYRFVSGEIVAITNDAEIQAIESATQTALAAVNTHIQNALALLADRKNPDYRKSIRESISAVETAATLISQKSKTTLEPALDTLATTHPIHPALRKGFENLYGYSSDAQGIQHPLLDEGSIDFVDAKFMLVACSAFVNYLVGKAA